MTGTRLALSVTTWLVASACASTGFAQMSSDQIIRSLQPTTRGIRPVAPSEPAAAASPNPASPTAASGFVARPGMARPGAARPGAGPAVSSAPGSPSPRPASVDLTVQFASGSAELTPQAVRTLDELGRALSSSALSGYRFRIEGHTDTVGAPEMNKTLSDARAAQVLEYLSSHWHVDRAKVETVGMGEDQLLVPTGPNVPEPRNRRVTVINLGA